MEESSSKNSSDNSGIPSTLILYFGIVLIISVLIASITGYFIGKNKINDQISNKNNVLSSSLTPISSTPTPIPITISTLSSIPQPTAAESKSCTKYGFAQKWEYLTSYIIKESDSMNIIAKEQLKDESRVNEILKINGAGPLVVGSTLYLPPSSIPKSSGNLKQIYGKLVEKNTASWKLLISTDPKGQGILIPTFIFEKISNKDSFKIGDCLKVFLDDGYEVYTVSIQ